MFQFRGKLLEVAPVKEYEGSPYSSVVVRSEDVADGQMIKYKLDLKKVDHSVLSDMLDEDLIFMVNIVKGANSTASVKVVGISA
jgi:hypothetical protein